MNRLTCNKCLDHAMCQGKSLYSCGFDRYQSITEVWLFTLIFSLFPFPSLCPFLL